MRIALGVLRPTRRGALARRPVDAGPGAASATCRRSAGSTRRCACSSSSSTWRGCTASAKADARRPRRGDCSRCCGVAAPTRPGGDALARQPAAGAAGGRARARARRCSCSTSRSRGWTRSASTCWRACCGARRANHGVPVVFSSHQLELVERLCDAVVLIDRGRVVAQGTIDELRARREPGASWRVEVRGRGGGVVGRRARAWRSTSGVRRRRSCSSWATASTNSGCSTSRAAPATSCVSARCSPTLAELFREVVRRERRAARDDRPRRLAAGGARDFWVRLRERSFLISTLRSSRRDLGLHPARARTAAAARRSFDLGVVGDGARSRGRPRGRRRSAAAGGVERVTSRSRRRAAADAGAARRVGRRGAATDGGSSGMHDVADARSARLVQASAWPNADRCGARSTGRRAARRVARRSLDRPASSDADARARGPEP